MENQLEAERDKETKSNEDHSGGDLKRKWYVRFIGRRRGKKDRRVIALD